MHAACTMKPVSEHSPPAMRDSMDSSLWESLPQESTVVQSARPGLPVKTVARFTLVPLQQKLMDTVHACDVDLNWLPDLPRSIPDAESLTQRLSESKREHSITTARFMNLPMNLP
jgi:hypothetical protein